MMMAIMKRMTMMMIMMLPEACDQFTKNLWHSLTILTLKHESKGMGFVLGVGILMSIGLGDHCCKR